MALACTSSRKPPSWAAPFPPLMRIRQLGNTTLIEFPTREEALAYAEGKRAYQELWMLIYQAEQLGLLSPN